MRATPRSGNRRLAEAKAEATGDLQHLLTFKIGQFLRSYNRSLAADYADRFGVTLNEWRALFLVYLSEDGGLSLGQLAEAAVYDRGLASRIVNELAARGLVRCIRNGRSVRIELTPAGSDLVARIVRESKARNARLLDRLTPAERSAVDVALDKLLDEARKMAGEAASR